MIFADEIPRQLHRDRFAQPVYALFLLFYLEFSDSFHMFFVADMKFAAHRVRTPLRLLLFQ